MSPTNLDPDSPDFEDQVAAAQALEDAANDNEDTGEALDEDQPEGDEPAADTPADPEAKPTEATAVVEAEKTEPADAQPKPAGVLSKDGSRVMPYSALQAERRAARHERAERERIAAELDATRKQLEDLKAGRKPEPAEADADELSADELAELADAIPAVGKLAKQLQATRAELAKLKPEAAKAEVTQEPEDDPVQEAIDAVPVLLDWQLTDAEKFERAKEYDALLMRSPKWANKPLAERFAEATRRVADEYDIQIDEDTPPPTNSKTTSRANPAEVIERATRQTPNTLSDMRGGAVDTDLGRIERLPAARALQRMADWSDEEIEAHLAKHG